MAKKQSPMYKTIKQLYDRGLLTVEELQKLVELGKITQAEMNEIVGGNE